MTKKNLIIGINIFKLHGPNNFYQCCEPVIHETWDHWQCHSGPHSAGTHEVSLACVSTCGAWDDCGGTFYHTLCTHSLWGRDNTG